MTKNKMKQSSALQVLIVLVRFSESLATKFLSLNDEPCMVSPALIDLHPTELKYYPFMISLDECTGSCNVLSPKICVPKEKKDINAEAFNMITDKNEAKRMAIHISCDCNANSLVQNVIQTKNGITEYDNVNVKIIIRAKKVLV